jgi:tight adherence protein C
MLVAGAWGVLAALPVAGLASRQSVVDRTRLLQSRTRKRRTVAVPRALRIVALVLAAPTRHRASRRRDAALKREIPVAIDLVSVAVGAGCTPYAAVEAAARWCPPLAASAFDAIPAACRLGASFDDALAGAARAAPALGSLADALTTANRLGAPIAPTLTRLSAEARADMRRAAEQHARTVPVRLLFPLVFLVLPAFGLLTVAPVLLDGFSRAH